MQTDYVAKTPAAETDLLIPFVDFMWQRASLPTIDAAISSICSDFHNLATAVAKIRHVFNRRGSLDRGVPPTFVATEIEYLVTVSRSIFDLLQEAIAELWAHVELADPEAESRRKGCPLPSTFSKVVLIDKRVLRTSEQIWTRFGVPSALAMAYAKHGAFFSRLRDVRDRVVHDGAELPIVFDTERGFCVNPGDRAFRGFEGWTDTHRYNENLVSILPWVAHIIFGTIDACSAIMAAFATEIRFPPELAPGYHVFVRGQNNRALLQVIEVQQGGSPWWSSEDPTK